MQATTKRNRQEPLAYEGSSDEEDSPKKTKAMSKKNHCEVEKRRRDKMNKYLTELATMIPACSAVPRKLDKLTVLKMAVEHVKALRGDPQASKDYKPSFLSDEELKQLVVEAANGFMVIINCQLGQILYVSETLEDVLHESPEAWRGQSFYDILHPKDIQKVKSQLECMSIEDTLKANSNAGYGKSNFVSQPNMMNGLRRSFLCRVRVAQSSGESSNPALKIGGDYSRTSEMMDLIHASHKLPDKYVVLHCTGFIRNLTGEECEALSMAENESSQCLIAMARLQPFGSGDTESGPPQEPSDTEFVARVSLDGRFSHLDHRVTAVLGYLPQDLIGQMCYEYFHPDDIRKMVELFHEACQKAVPMPTVRYRFVSRDRNWVWLAMKAFSFRNPYSKQVEYIICTNVLLNKPTKPSSPPLQISQQPSSTGQPALPTVDIVDRRDLTERFVRQTMAQQAQWELNQQGQTQQGPQQDVLQLPMGSGNMYGSVQQNPTPSSQGGMGMVQPYGSSARPMQNVPATSFAPTSVTHPIQGHPQQQFPWQPPTTSGTVQHQRVDIEQNSALARDVINRMGNTPDNPFGQQLPNSQPRNPIRAPEGLFDSQTIDLEGSKEAYMAIIRGLDNPSDFQALFDQVDVDPFNPVQPFKDLDLDSILD